LPLPTPGLSVRPVAPVPLRATVRDAAAPSLKDRSRSFEKLGFPSGDQIRLQLVMLALLTPVTTSRAALALNSSIKFLCFVMLVSPPLGHILDTLYVLMLVSCVSKILDPLQMTSH